MITSSAYSHEVETRRWEYFRVLAEDGNFSRAARRLRISQPALSQQIQRLEEEIGTRLVDRTSRPVVLTEIGRQLLVRSTDLLDAAASMERLVGSAGRGETGRLQVGVIPLALLGPAPGWLRAFRRRFPDVQMTLRRDDSAVLVDLLEDARLDAVFLTATPTAPGLSCAELWTTALELVVPDDHRLAGAGSVALGELRREPLVSFPREVAPENFDVLITACAAAGFSPRLVTTTGGYADQVGYVAAGEGLALVPAEAAAVGVEGVVRVPLAETLELTMRVAWRPGPLTSQLRAFLSLVTGPAGGEEVRSRRPPPNR